jgi:hypothetical protein
MNKSVHLEQKQNAAVASGKVEGNFERRSDWRLALALRHRSLDRRAPSVEALGGTTVIKKLVLPVFVAAVVTLVATERIASSPATSTLTLQPPALIAEQPQRPQITWRKRLANGVDLGVVYEPDLLNGKIARVTTPNSGKPKDFINDDTYYGQLPAEVRGDSEFVHFILRATAREKADEGTVLDIDGAILGFTSVYDERSDRSRVELVAKSIGFDGKPQWIPLGMTFQVKPGQHVPLPRLAVHLNHADGMWALQLNDLVIRSGLFLATDATVPTISVRAGKVGDTARLLDLRIDRKAPLASARNLVVTNGRIDLKKEYESGNSRIKVFGIE